MVLKLAIHLSRARRFTQATQSLAKGCLGLDFGPISVTWVRPFHDSCRVCVSYFYEVTLHTGDLFGAGTDADVYVRIIGKNGSSSEIKLPTKKTDLERGMVNKYRVAADYVGPVQKLIVRHNSRGVAPAWYLDKLRYELTQSLVLIAFTLISVRKQLEDNYSLRAVVKDSYGHVYNFTCKDWLEESSSKDPIKLLKEDGLSVEEPDEPNVSAIGRTASNSLTEIGSEVDASLRNVFRQIVATDIPAHSVETHDTAVGVKGVEDRASVTVQSSPSHAAAVNVAIASTPKPASHLDLPLSPAVRFLLSTYEVEQHAIKGSGRHSRILKSDVLKYLNEKKIDVMRPHFLAPPTQTIAPATASSTPDISPRSEYVPPIFTERKPAHDLATSNSRSATASSFVDRLVSDKTRAAASLAANAKFVTPHVYASVSCNSGKLDELLGEIPAHPSNLEAFLIRSLCVSLAAVPAMNVSYDGEDSMSCSTVDVDILHGRASGPVCRLVKCEDLQFVQMLLQMQTGDASADHSDVTISRFSVSAPRRDGVSQSTAVLLPGRIAAITYSLVEPGLDEHGRPLSTAILAATVDGRAVDLSVAVQFLEKFKSCIENPALSWH